MRRLIWFPKVLPLSLSLGWALSLSSCNSASAEKAAVDADGVVALEAAHVAFVKKDLRAMGLAIKDVMFSDAEPELKFNALRLLDQTYTENCAYEFPADWSLPAQVSDLRVGIGRNQKPESVGYKIKITGQLQQADNITQLRLVKHPAEVVVDKTAGIGEWSVEVNPEDPSDIYFELAKYSREKADPGLYLLQIVTNDGKTTDGWFLVTDQVASASPEVVSPSVGQRYHSGMPQFVWKDFKSPEYKPCERRRLSIYVSQLPGEELFWYLYDRDPAITAATVGTDGGGRTLTPGRYWFGLTYREARPFGPLSLVRHATTSRDFYVD
jgi:hypothetical protein